MADEFIRRGLTMYKELTGVCLNCPGCVRLEQESFLGVEECKYMPSR